MKRIVECPSCKTKMQIFDIGKEINQKCPRCQNNFEIHPEEKEDSKKKKAVTEKPAEKKIIKKSAAAVKKTKTKTYKRSIDTTNKPITSTKPTPTPAPAPAPAPAPPAATAPEPLPEPHPAGFSRMQFIILFVLLVIAIIIQVVFAKKQMAQLSIVNKNLQTIHNKL